MARKSGGARQGFTPVEATEHADKRLNLPTADAHDFVTPEVEQVGQQVWPRDPSLDPQLVWKGKDERAGDLVVDVPPIYIQEKVDPRVLVENLRRTAAAGEPEPEATLFDTFDGLDDLDLVDFYEHDANWSNRMILGDSLQVMASLAEREQLRGKVQMIYLDPPYGISFKSNWQPTIRSRDVPDGKVIGESRQVEQIKAFRDTWELGIGSYLTYLRDRLTVARDLLTASGSIFVQIGDENVHLVRSLLDEVFGSENFVSPIGFVTTSSQTAKYLGSIADSVLWYAKQFDALKYRPLYVAKDPRATGGWGFNFVEVEGQRRPLTRDERSGRLSAPAGRLFMLDNLASQGVSTSSTEFSFDGRAFSPGPRNHWKTHADGMARLAAAGRIVRSTNQIRYARFFDDFAVQPLSNLWSDTTQAGFVDEKAYVVQTMSKVVQRCLLMSTDPGDLVLDPTCGSGTTAYVAEQWGRRWITIDTSRVALALARQRLMAARYPYYVLADSQAGRRKEGELLGKPLPPAEVTNDIRHGFVYERVQHITLKSIANNPDIHEGMSREEIDAAIKRHADFEVLYDRPYEDRKTVRVTGKFTVESLSPHRSLSFSPATDLIEDRESRGEQQAAVDAEGPTFEQTILDNLAKAGIQNGARAERLEFATLDPYAGSYLQALGDQLADEDADSARVAIAIGPQYGTVSPAFIKAAAREAMAAEVDLLCVLGFAFDPTALGVTTEDGVTVEAGEDWFADVAGSRRVGRVRVLFVRMNSDLLMGEDLKKTGAGNLFTVFGEPDIGIVTTDAGQLVVELRGVDVYDPTTGDVRSGSTDQVALWMVDTAYNEESFFVRQCYFTGGGDPYKRLRTALKAEIDPDAWASLYATTSRPFDRPDTGRIAVKVINDYGDEVVKVFPV